MNVDALLLWSRLQFALTACYHWLFVPLTLGLGVIMSIAETKYYRTNRPEWKRWAMFWQKLFGINFAIGVATGLILEFEFGTNWSNYSWLVGDIFGAPLAIEGILAFFMEATFIAIMFFGWNKVSRGFHLASTWLTVIGATISAVWILVANSWMQDPVGMSFNPATVRSEMTDFWAVALSSTAVNKFWHTTISSWTLGAAFALGVCGIYMLRGKHREFALANSRIIAPFGLIAALLTAYTGDTSGYNVAKTQPMKLAAMEALYDAGESTPDGKTIDGKGLGLSAIGLLDCNNLTPLAGENQDPYLFDIKIPSVLSLLGTGSCDGYLPGINNILEGGYYDRNGNLALSADERMNRGRVAIEALAAYGEAKKIGDSTEMERQNAIIQENFDHFGYGYIQDKADLVPNVPLVYYAFRIMVGVGCLLILIFFLSWILQRKKSVEQYSRYRWLHVLAIVCMPLAWIASQAGWIVTELGRQPWAIQDMLPLNAAVSKLAQETVMTTFIIFALLFTILLIAELSIMIKAIKHGPESYLNDVEQLFAKRESK